MPRKITLFYAVTALFWFSLYAYVPIIAPYSQDLNASLLLTGLITGSYGFVQMLLRIPLGIASDIIKKRKIFLTLGIVLAIISGLGVFLIQNRYSLLFFRGLSGAAASTWVIFTILFSSYFNPNESMKAVGILNSANSFGTLSAMLLGGIAANLWGPQYAFLLAAVVGVAALILSTGIIENVDIQKKPLKIGEVIGYSIRSKSLMSVSILAIITQYITFSTTQGFTGLVASELGADSFLIGLLSMVSTIPGLFMSPLSGTFFMRKFGVRKTVMGGFMLSALACVAVPFSANLLMLFITQFLGGIGRFAVMPLLMGLSIQNEPDERRGSAMGFFQAIYGLGMFIGPAITGLISSSLNMTSAFIAAGIVGFIGVAASWKAINK